MDQLAAGVKIDWVTSYKKSKGQKLVTLVNLYRGAVKSLARPTSRYVFFDGENISFDANLVIYIYK